MRVSANDGPLSVRALAGSRVVLLGIDVAPEATSGLLGFALRRSDRATGVGHWLPNFLRFERNAQQPGAGGSDENPVQAFVWGDYTVAPGARLTYRVEARYGSPDNLTTAHAVDLDVDVEPTDDGRHGIYFNRGAAGSQAYAEKFHDRSPLTDTQAAAWLSRGLEEALLAFIAAAEPGVALCGAFYEFKHTAVLDALGAAVGRGVDVQLIVARPAANSHGQQPYPGEDNVEPAHAAGLDGVVTWRTRCDGIPHNKFLLRLDGETPTAVWTGSTNVTDGAFYGQSNVGHLVHDQAVAAAYLSYWQHLKDDPDTADLRDRDDADNPPPAPGPPPAGLGEVFSPHHGTGVLEWYASLIADRTNQAVFLTAPFGISAEFEAVLLQPHAFPVYALLDKGDNHMDLLRAASGNELVAGAYLGQGAWHQFLHEALVNKLNPNVRYIHTKYLLIDPLSDDPIVITGSANFSGGSVSTNDENMLLIRGDTRVADIYLTEFMRLFTHMYFRARVAGDAGGGQTRAPTPQSRGDATPLYLATDDSWTAAWYGGDDAKTRERELFAP